MREEEDEGRRRTKEEEDEGRRRTKEEEEEGRRRTKEEEREEEEEGRTGDRRKWELGASSLKDIALMDEMEDRLEDAGLVKAPDGGFGWAVVLASFCTNAIVDGVIFTGQCRLCPSPICPFWPFPPFLPPLPHFVFILCTLSSPPLSQCQSRPPMGKVLRQWRRHCRHLSACRLLPSFRPSGLCLGQ